MISARICRVFSLAILAVSLGVPATATGQATETVESDAATETTRNALKIRGALGAGESAEMDGDPAAALASYRQALEGIAALHDDTRPPFLAQAELLLRRLYKLAGIRGAYRELLPIFERWGDFDEEAPASEEPGLAALARFVGAASAAYSGDLARAEKNWDPLGFLDGWRVIGPFENERGGGFDTAYGPETDTRPDDAVAHAGKTRDVSWRPLPAAPITGWVDLDQLMRPNDQALAYALTFVDCERDLEASLRLGTDEGYRLWVNGHLVASRDLRRRMRFDQDAIGIRLRKGWNSILLKVMEETGRWEFRCRLAGPRGGPLAGWTEADPPPDADLPRAPADVEERADTQPTVTVDTGTDPTGTIDKLRERLAGEGDRDPHLHYLLGVIIQDRRAHDVNEHPDREALERAIELHATPVSPIYHYLLAQAQRRVVGVTADRDDNAWRRSLERAASGEPPAVVALVDLARYYLDTFGNVEKARQLLERALGRNANSADARLLLGRLEDRLKFPRALDRAYADVVRGDAISPNAQRYVAEKLLERGRLKEAELILRRILSLNANDRVTRSRLVQVLLDLERRDEATALLRQGLIYYPFDVAPRQRLVNLHRGWGDLEGALRIQREVVALAPDDHTFRRAEGELLWQLGRSEEAFAAWEAALELQPNYPELRQYLDFLRSRRDPFVEEFRRDVEALVAAARAEEIPADDLAETLLDLTVVEVNADGTAKEFHQEVFRVLNDRGVELYKNYRTYYARGDQRVEFKKARVIYRDGGEDRARLRVYAGGSRGSGADSRGSDYRAAGIELPPLEPGDIVEVQYVREDLHQSFFGDYFGRREIFQSELPLREKTFVLRAPATKKLYFHYRRLDLAPQVARDAETDRVTYSWTRRDIAKLKPEPGMPPAQETSPLLAISTFESWDAFSSWYWNLIRQQFESSPQIASKVRELTSGKTKEIEKIRAVYDFVVQEVRYNAWEFGVHGFKPYNAPTIFARRFGDCKDKATLISVMLGEVGIQAYPVLIYATNSRGEEDLTLPMVNHFNHCITYVPPAEGRDGLYLDGTAQYNRLEELPAGDRGARVLVVRPDGGSVEQVPWNPPRDLAIEEDVQVRLDADGSAVLEIRGRTVGDLGATLRSVFELPGKRRRNLELLYGPRFAGVTVEEEEFSELARLRDPVTFRIRLTVPKLVQPAPEGLSMRPLDDFYQTSQQFSALGSLEKRSFDLLLGAPRRSLLQVTVHLPPGVRVKSLPQDRILQNRFGRLEVTHRREEGRLHVERLLELTSHRVSSNEYAGFRELAAALGRLAEEKWVLERQEGNR